MSGNDNTSYTVRVVSATTTLTNNDYVLSVESPAANVTVNLPAVASVQPGRTYIIKRDATATQTVTLDGNGSETINGAATRAVGAAGTAGAVVIISDGGEWHVIGSY
ncbi:baseplate wedge protein [Streptomyces phage Zeigle]|jgi:hypothetical protein|uniref:Baseplate wedge protein n=1 Tax=Streptomyces phage Zeigle TaxID=2767569 RepID=A0A7G9UY54_9CAUD|nr:baseplate wedge protein [Streptomyces phage Zeigle]WNA15445.1 minor tail protein [Streptomyces phage Kumquat]